jgi:hypothetical protein
MSEILRVNTVLARIIIFFYTIAPESPSCTKNPRHIRSSGVEMQINTKGTILGPLDHHNSLVFSSKFFIYNNFLLRGHIWPPEVKGEVLYESSDV